MPALTLVSQSEPIRLGLLRLADAAPLIVAAERGLFADEGLHVALSVEPSWANIADKLTWRGLEGAVLLPPLAIAIALGLRGAGAALTVPLGLSRAGNAATLASKFDLTAAIAAGKRPRLAVVHAFSTHHILLRLHLTRLGFNPERDIAWDVIPPARMVDALAQDRIDGFCAGAPWSEVAARAGLGRTLVRTSEIWPAHPEKIFAVTASFAAADPARLAALNRALLRAGTWCAEASHADELSHLLAAPKWFDLDAAALRTCLPGADAAHGDRIIFGAMAAIPHPGDAAWYARAMAASGWLAADTVHETTARALYHPDLAQQTAHELALAIEPGRGDAASPDAPLLPAPKTVSPIEGLHDARA